MRCYRISLLQPLICIGRVDVVASTAILMKPVILWPNSEVALSLTVEALVEIKIPNVRRTNVKVKLVSGVKLRKDIPTTLHILGLDLNAINSDNDRRMFVLIIINRRTFEIVVASMV